MYKTDMESTPAQFARAALIKADQIREQYRNMPGAFIGTAVVASLVAAILFEKVPARAVLWGWLAAAYGNSCLRWVLWTAFRRARPPLESMPRWGIVLTVSTVIAGCVWGIGGIVLHVPGSLSYQLFVLFVNTGLSFTSTFVAGSYMPAFTAFAFPTFVLSALPFLGGDTLHVAIGVVALLFLPPITRYAWLQCRDFLESVEFRMRNAELLEELRAQKAAAEAANVAKSRFLAVASHDLRQPLHALGLFVEALQESTLPHHERQLIGNIRRTVDTMGELFDELLDISRLDAGVVRARVTTFPLATVFERLDVQFGPVARQKGLRLCIRPTSLIVRSDPRHLARILGNLLANALRYTERGRVVLGCRRRSGQVRLEVWDTGRGIPQDKHTDIFQEFAQLENPDREQGKGLGLGLAIVAGLAKLLDHAVELRSSVGRGSMFAVTLPRGPELNSLPLEVATQVATTFDLTGLLVLVIGDEREACEEVESLLRKWGCEAIIGCSRSQVAARLQAVSKVPHLIIADCDCAAPASLEGGAALVRMLRNEFNVEIPALLVAGGHERGPSAATAECDLPVLRTPLNPARLRTLIVNLLRCSPAGLAEEPQQVRSFGSVRS